MNGGRRRVVLCSDYLDIGGTVKGMQEYALALDRNRYDVRVIGLLGGGVRAARLEAAGIPVEIADGDRSRLSALLDGTDVVHVFRIGLPEPLLPAACRDARVNALVETNIFGQVDVSADEPQFDCHLFISKMCALRYRRRTEQWGSAFHSRHTVSYLPVDLRVLRAATPDRHEAKRRLGLDPMRPVVLRVGRDDDRKWRNLIVDMVPQLRELVPSVQVVFVGVTPSKLRRLDRSGSLPYVHLLPLLSDERLAAVYAAADVFVSAAEIGESQGLAMTEAMGLGVPVVTSPTSWVDNAQVELVDEGVDGHLASHPRQFAEAIADLLLDDGRRERFAQAARRKVAERFDAGGLARGVEALYESLLAGGGVPPQWSPSPAEVDAFTAEYEARCRHEFRPLTAAERHEVCRSRARERIAWTARAARSLDGHSLRAGVWAARGRLTLAARSHRRAGARA
jgi:glycosyltransferase involved in cell wall biosynthesis